ncbi:MAG TPA: hypothetical protein VFO39_14355 [Candidatus Sulfotelmatobacter sp.]|nr:hypothetical protein [Candidatus Sulfotelmatobacter sp.]
MSLGLLTLADFAVSGLPTLACLILLPVLPAYFLFKALPATADVSGPFQGLQIKLSGAFAGYFLLFVFIIYNLKTIMPPASAQVWEISGHVTDANGGRILRLDPTDVALSPPGIMWDNDGGFTIRVTTTETPGGGTEYPRLNVGHDKFQPVTISLDPEKLRTQSQSFGGITIRPEYHQIEFGHIALQGDPSFPAYAATGQPPAAISAAQEPHQ